MGDVPEKKGLTHEEYGRFVTKLHEIAYWPEPFKVRSLLQEFVKKVEIHYENL